MCSRYADDKNGVGFVWPALAPSGFGADPQPVASARAISIMSATMADLFWNTSYFGTLADLNVCCNDVKMHFGTGLAQLPWLPATTST